jgi:hypothetical protein
MGPPTRVYGTSHKGQWDLPEGSMGPPRRVYGTSHKGRWDLPQGSMGPPIRVDGTSQKGRWDLPQGSMGPPRRVDGTSQKGRWDLPEGSMGQLYGVELVVRALARFGGPVSRAKARTTSGIIVLIGEPRAGEWGYGEGDGWKPSLLVSQYLGWCSRLNYPADSVTPSLWL